MFTVLHVLRDGTEHLYSAHNIDVQASGVPHADFDDRIFWYTDKSGQVNKITEGDIFVMNDFGKTVRKYFLGEWPPHKGGMSQENT